MKLAYASRKDRMLSLVFSALTGALFAYGFIPASQRAFKFFSHWIPKVPAPWNELKEMSFFPLLALLFLASLPSRRSKTSFGFVKSTWRMSILPVFIAFVFGRAIGNHWNWDLHSHLSDTVWYLVFIPLGEECLFRGWLYGVLDRIWPEKLFTATNPLPVAVWGSAVGFSIWHFQNYFHTATWLFTLQLFYTFITGLWLGVLRSKTGQVWPAVLAHFAINFVAGS